MARCFGEVVDASMLESMGLPNTQANRARIANLKMYNDDKKGQAIRYLDNLKNNDYGNGASTLCLVYNATGDPLVNSASHDWLGSIYQLGYPAEIGNGQWAAFLHVHPQGKAEGSEGAVVYLGKNKSGQDRDFLLAWSTPWGPWYTNKAYCEIGTVNFCDGRWKEIKQMLEDSSYVSDSTADGTEIKANTERGSSPTFTATIKVLP